MTRPRRLGTFATPTRSSRVARHRYDVLPLQVLRHVPLLGWPVSDAGKLLGAATQVASAGNDALGIYGAGPRRGLEAVPQRHGVAVARSRR